MIQKHETDVVVVGGGPAGISACLELDRLSDLSITLLEAEDQVGGMPRSCGPGFGMRDQHRFLSGPAYARRLERLLRKTRTRVLTGTTALALESGEDGEHHLVEAASPQGLSVLACRRVVLATGCFESSRESRLIPGDRPAGIMTTGTLQQLVKLRELKPGQRALILGTESVSLSAALTLRGAGAEVAGLVEEETRPCTYPAVLAGFKAALGFPVFYGAQVRAIRGQGRVQGVVLERGGREWTVACDTVIVSGRFRPDAALAESAGVALDPASRGPAVDQGFRTSTPGVLAAGNLLRGAEMHDLCGLEGRAAARSLIRDLNRGKTEPGRTILVRTLPPLRFATPQFLDPYSLGPGPGRGGFPVLAVQLARTLLDPVLEVWSGERMVWRKRYGRLIGRTRLPLPVGRFHLPALDPAAGLVVRVR